MQVAETMVAVTTTEAMTAPTTVPKKVVAKLAQPLANLVSPANQASPVKVGAAVVVVVARATRSSSPKTVRPSAR